MFGYSIINSYNIIITFSHCITLKFIECYKTCERHSTTVLVSFSPFKLNFVPIIKIKSNYLSLKTLKQCELWVMLLLYKHIFKNQNLEVSPKFDTHELI